MTEDSVFDALASNNPSLLGAIRIPNRVLERYVAYHKQIERRMDGSSGGVFGAILETLAHDDFYFSGAKFDDNLRLHHIVFNDPALISSISGYKPVLSDCSGVFFQIRELLAAGKKVVFGGTSLQCYALQQYVGNTENLVTIDFIHTEFIAQEVLEKYSAELSKQFGSKVVDIRFNNKEFANNHAKRITLENGRVFYTKKEDVFDKLAQSGKFTRTSANLEVFGSLDYRVSDFTIGAYKVDRIEDDGLGFAYLSVNSDKASDIIKKAKKRLVIVKEGKDVSEKDILYRKCRSSQNVDLTVLSKKSLTEIASDGLSKTKAFRTKRLFGAIKRGFEFAQYNPLACLRFIQFNFCNKNIKTDYDHDGFFYVAPYCAFKLPDAYCIELHGPLMIGSRRIKESRIETRLRMETGSMIIVRESCSFGAGSNIEIYKNAVLDVGDLQSNAELNIICGERITLGSPCNVARNATIRDTSGHLIATPGYKMTKPVTIGNHVWVCTESTIMPGVTIGDGAIVGACSFVTKKVKPFTMVQGNPALEAGSIKYFKI